MWTPPPVPLHPPHSFLPVGTPRVDTSVRFASSVPHHVGGTDLLWFCAFYLILGLPSVSPGLILRQVERLKPWFFSVPHHVGCISASPVSYSRPHHVGGSLVFLCRTIVFHLTVIPLFLYWVRINTNQKAMCKTVS